jgi:sporulation protein YlmC with PRC-barrel domain
VAQGTRQPAADQLTSIRETLTSVDAVTLSADDLIGATVYGTNDENIGEIGDIILSDKEEIEAYIVEVGGFLGIGEKPVAIDAADLDVMKDENSNLYVFTPFTSEQLDNQPEYDETAYQENRDANVLTKDK